MSSTYDTAAARKAGRRRRWLRRWLLRGSIGSVAALVGALLLFHVLAWLFPFDLSRLRTAPASPRVLDRYGRVIRVRASRDDAMRFAVSGVEMSRWVRQATVAIEDRNFRHHLGVDPFAIARACGQNLTRGRVHSGASTLTMQLVRILDDRPRTLAAKIVESFYALQIDAGLGKDAILTAYLNLAPYGGNLHGVEAAAQRYFDKNALEVTLAEAALLAGLPQSPSRYRPDRYYDRAIERAGMVLDAMLDESMITPGEHAAAKAERPTISRRPWPFEAPHFAELALSRSGAHPRPTARTPSIVRTTLDRDAQACVEAHVEAFFAARPAAKREGLSVAAVAIEVDTAAVRALLGSADFFDADRCGQVNVAVARRSPGSTLKPFLWALGFDRGVVTRSTYLADVPTPFVGYVPENYDRGFRGPVPAAKALQESLNIPALRLQKRVGTREFLAALRGLGLETLGESAAHYGLTLCLGGGEVRLLDLTNAYAALARGGRWRPETLVVSSSIRAPDPMRDRQVVSEGAAYLVLDALSDADHLERAGVRRQPGEPIVGYKTGTSFGLRDAWTVAFTSRFAVGVWVGDPAGRSHSDLIGVRTAAPLALGIARELSARGPALVEWPRPSSVVEQRVCAVSGYRAGRWCNGTRTADALLSASVGAVSSTRCPVHREVLVDPQRQVELCDGCAHGARGHVHTRGTHREHLRVEEWPIEVAAWLRENGAVGSRERWPHDPDCRRAVRRDEREAPRILSPLDGEEYRLVQGASMRQRLQLAATAGSGVRQLWWFVDGELRASSAPGEAVSWPLRAGDHSVRCIDDRGRASLVRIRVASAPAAAEPGLSGSS